MEVKSLDKLDFFFIQKTHVQAYNAMWNMHWEHYFLGFKVRGFSKFPCCLQLYSVNKEPIKIDDIQASMLYC